MIREWFDWWFGGVSQARIEMAFRRIEDLEKQCGNLAATAHEQQRDIADLRKQAMHLRIAASAAPAKPAPVRARSWREVQEFVEAGGNDAA